MSKREYRDIFIKNYNPKLLIDDPRCQDIWNSACEGGAYLVASYTAKYTSKEEAGKSSLFKGI